MKVEDGGNGLIWRTLGYILVKTNFDPGRKATHVRRLATGP